MKRALALAVFVVASLIVPACSSSEGGTDGGEEVISGASRERTPDPVAERIEKAKTDGAIGDRVKAGNLSFRIFEIRAQDRIFSMSKPGADPVSRGNTSSEYVAIDFLAENISGSPLTTGAEAKLIDDAGNPHKQDDSIEPPSGGTAGMELGTGQTRASTMFFRVPNGTVPETLVVETRKGMARFDLLSRNTDGIPPEAYLLVYHLYFNERAYEEAYDMFDSGSVRDITLGEWLSFWEPLWGKQYVLLDDLRPLFEKPDLASFLMTRTLYDRQGDIAANPTLQPTATQELARIDGEWKLLMGEELASDIVAVIGPDEPPVSENTAPEDTGPESTAPENTNDEPDRKPATVLETTGQVR